MTHTTALDAIRDGPAALSAFQSANPGTILDFSNVDFREPENASIRFSDLEFLLEVTFEGAIFGDTPIPHQVHGYPPGRGATMGCALFQNSVFYKGASFTRVNFGANARFDGCVFREGASFFEANFAGHANFSRSVFESAGFDSCIFGYAAHFDEAIFLKGCSFEEAAFGNDASFDGASFAIAHFQSSHFGERAGFEYAVFSELAQFNNTKFGAGANFAGTSFFTRAAFESAIFGDYASFAAGDAKILEERVRARATKVAPEFRNLLIDRALQADPSSFNRASFYFATFSSTPHRYGTALTSAVGSVAKAKELAREAWRLIRVFFYPRSPLLKHGPSGANFRNRQLKGPIDFSCARFSQPPDFQNVAPAEDIDLAEATFSFASNSWPRLNYWTTQTETLTRLRRLRGIAKDIDEIDVESSLFALQRLAERGVSWRLWWDQVLHGWGIYDLISERVESRQNGNSIQRRQSRLKRLVRSVWIAAVGVGRPIMLTALVTLYRYSSNFGRSVLLPTFWLGLAVIGPAVHYSQSSRTQLGSGGLADSITFSLCQLIIVTPVSKYGLETTMQRLFPLGLPPEVIQLALAQSVIGTILLFLIALALRNHFRLR